MHWPNARLGRVWTGVGWKEGAAVVAILLVTLVVRLPTLNIPLLEDFPFRQAETAYPALLFHEHGINLLAPQLPILGKPWQVPFEFPLFQAMAALVMDVGVVPDLALRVCDLICFMATAVAVWGLVRHLSTRTAAAIALLIFVACPFDVYWSRTSMIEYMATALAVGYAWAGMIWIDGRRTRYAVLAVVLGTLAMLVKLTSAVFWMVPLILYWGARSPRQDWHLWLRERVRVGLVLFPVPLIFGAVWTLHADSIKAGSAATRWLTSGALVNFNFGPISERLNLDDWGAIIHPLDSFVTGLPLWQFALICVIAIWRQRRAVWVGILLAGILPVATFFNLYVVQDYYLAAITPIIAAILGYALDGLMSHLRTWPTRALGATAMAAWLGVTLYSTRAYLAPIYGPASDPAQVLPAAKEIDAGTRPNDLIVFDGLDWSPAVPYYARRTGMMLPLEIVTPQLLDSLPGQGYRYLFTVTSQPSVFSNTAHQVLKRWAWFGEVSPQLFHLGQTYSSVSSADVAASDAPVAPPSGSAALLPAPTKVACGGAGTTVELAPGTTVTLVLSLNASDSDLSLDVNGAWIPAERTIVVKPQMDVGGSLDLSCAGGTDLVVTQAYALSP
jgi:hypothetical protein